jgi:hypothetical protein
MMTVQNGLVAAFAPPGTITEAFTWLTTVAFGASAIGSAIGGAVVELPGGVAAAFALAAAAPAIAWLIASFAPGRPGSVRAGVSETPSFAHDTPAPPASEGRGLEAGSGARGSGGLVPIGSAEPGGAA